MELFVWKSQKSDKENPPPTVFHTAYMKPWCMTIQSVHSGNSKILECQKHKMVNKKWILPFNVHNSLHSDACFMLRRWKFTVILHSKVIKLMTWSFPRESYSKIVGQCFLEIFKTEQEKWETLRPTTLFILNQAS